MMTKKYLPHDTRVYAIDDIHGGFNLLQKMMTEICDCERTQQQQTVYLVFFGDYVNRGKKVSILL